MQKKYSTALGTKYADFGFSKEVFDRVASQRLKTIANEDEIDGDIAKPETLMLLMKEMQGSNDVLRTKVSQTQRELDNLKTKQQTNQSQDPSKEPESELATQLKTMMEMMMGMKAEMDAGKKKAQTDAVLAQVHEKMKANGCTNDFIRNITLKGVEIGENDTADSLAEKYKSIYDQNCKDAYGEGYTPPKGNGNGGDGDYNKENETAILKRAGLL